MMACSPVTSAMILVFWVFIREPFRESNRVAPIPYLTRCGARIQMNRPSGLAIAAPAGQDICGHYSHDLFVERDRRHGGERREKGRGAGVAFAEDPAVPAGGTGVVRDGSAQH
jgi:hypothetical protein